MIWAFLLGAYAARFAIFLFVGTKACGWAEGEVTSIDAVEIFGMALLWPLFLCVLLGHDD